MAVALMISSPRFVPRPELLSFVYFAVYLVLLEGYPRNGRAIYLLVPLQILWVNTQGIFAVGVALIGCYWLGAALAFLPVPRGWRQESALTPVQWRQLTVVLVLVVLACFVNPWGVEGALFPFQLLPRVTGSSLFSSRIGEFRAPLEIGVRAAARVHVAQPARRDGAVVPRQRRPLAPRAIARGARFRRAVHAVAPQHGVLRLGGRAGDRRQPRSLGSALAPAARGSGAVSRSPPSRPS